MPLSKLVIAAGVLAIATAPLCAQTSIVIGPDVPHDIAREAPSDAYEVKLAQFAWQQFVALGWKATYDPAAGNFTRGVADPSWNGAGTPPHAVWETFAHRMELRPFGTRQAPPSMPAALARPDYQFEVRSSGKLLQGMDETGAPASLTLLNNLDEDNEIGSADIYLGTPTDRTTAPLVLYQAKANQDEYDYVRTTFPDQWDPQGSLSTAIAAGQAGFKTRPLPTDLVGCGAVPAGSAVRLPCGVVGGAEGAIEIKTAFLKIPPGQEGAFADFFVRDAIYYTQGLKADGTGDGTFTYHNAKFALIGMHVIHKTENYPGFIYTSFEHRDLAKMDFTFVLLSPLPPEYGPFNPHGAPAQPKGSTLQTGDLIAIERQTDTAGPVSDGRLYPVPAQFGAVNDAAQAQLAAIGSIWANYTLIGVQALQTDSYAATPGAGAGPNHFMANHVIESDAFLGNFFGPGFSSSDPIFPTGPKAPDGTSNGDNSYYQGKTFNMGGCKGCHGVAQTFFGTDSSFLLDFGVNKPVSEPDTLFYVPEPAPATASTEVRALRSYLSLQ